MFIKQQQFKGYTNPILRQLMLFSSSKPKVKRTGQERNDYWFVAAHIYTK